MVELVYQYGVIFDEELSIAKATLQADADARFAQWRAAWDAQIGGLQAELVGLWIADTVIGAGLIVYGIVRADPAVIATGVVVVGGGAFRLVIEIK